MRRYGIQWQRQLDGQEALTASPGGAEKLDAHYQEQVKLWVRNRGREGWLMVSRPAPPFYTPRVASDPVTGASWRADGAWVIVAARWKKHGVTDAWSYDDWNEMQEARHEVGAAAESTSTGIDRWLRSKQHDERMDEPGTEA